MHSSSPPGSSPSIHTSASTSNGPTRRTYSRRSTASASAKRRPAAHAANGSDDEKPSDAADGPSSSPTESRPTKRPRMALASSPSVQQPSIALQPPTSSPRPKPPSTPPRTSSRHAHRPTTPLSSPRDLTELFQSPGSESPRRGPRPGGLRRMLTKTQSLGIGLDSPAKEGMKAEMEGEEADSPFGKSMASGSGGPSTPSRGFGKTVSAPELGSPSGRGTGNGGEGGGGEEGDLSALLLGNPREDRGEGSGGQGSGGRAKRTYGRMRSFLAEGLGEGDHNEEDGRGGREEEVPGEVKESYKELRRRFEVDVTGGSGGEGNLMADLLATKAPQPVSDMRSKGENRRFMDEVAYLADGIADQATGINLKRASSIDLLRSVQESGWRAKMVVCGQTERIWEAFLAARGECDDVMDTVCVLFLATLVKAGEGLEALLQSLGGDVMGLVLDLARARRGPLDVETGKQTGSIRKLRTSAQQLDLSTAPLRLRAAASFVLATLCQEPTWAVIQPDFRAGRGLSRVIKAFQSEAKSLSARFDLFEKGLELLPPDSSEVDVFHLLNLSEIVASLVLVSTEDRDALMEEYVELSTDMLDVVIGCTAVALGPQGDHTSLAAGCVVELLKTLANLGNLSAQWAQAITPIHGALLGLARILLRRQDISEQLHDNSRRRVVAQGGEIREESMTAEELLCLVLALLTTMVIADFSTSEALATLSIDETCLGQHGCLRSCRCFDAVPFASHVVTLYLEQLGRSDEATANIITGYLALLLAKLLTSSPSSGDLILPPLPGSTRVAKLKGLLSALSELSGLQSIVHRKLRNGEVPKRAGDETGEGDESLGSGGLEQDANILKDAMDDLERLIVKEGR